MEQECQSEEGLPTDYNVAEHIYVALIILAFSLAGTILPMLSMRGSNNKKQSNNNRFTTTHEHHHSQQLSNNEYLSQFQLLLLKAFGTGVILSTGYVHMFPPADQNLTSKCITGWPWISAYKSWAGLLALLATLGTQMIQTIAISHFSTSHRHHSSSSTSERCLDDVTSNSSSECCHVPPLIPPDSHNHSHGISTDLHRIHVHCQANGVDGVEEWKHRSHFNGEDTDGNEDLVVETNPLLLHQQPQPPLTERRNSTLELRALTLANNIHGDDCCNINHEQLLQTHTHRLITAYILEFGIALHSMIIGFTIGVSGSGGGLIGLCIAVAFHQFFEGFALATTAFEAGFQNLTYPVLMCLGYTLTTPLGIGIGILVAEQFRNGGEVSLLVVVGVMDAVSAGILIYDAIVNMLTSNITHNRYFSELSVRKKCAVFFCLWLGVGAMSTLGLWI